MTQLSKHSKAGWQRDKSESATVWITYLGSHQLACILSKTEVTDCRQTSLSSQLNAMFQTSITATKLREQLNTVLQVRVVAANCDQS